MSDVERSKCTTTGVDSAPHHRAATTATTGTTTATSTSTTINTQSAAAKAATLKLHQQQHYHQQLYHSAAGASSSQPQYSDSNKTHYCNSTSNTTSSTTNSSTQSQSQSKPHHHHHGHHHHHHHHHRHQHKHQELSQQTEQSTTTTKKQEQQQTNYTCSKATHQQQSQQSHHQRDTDDGSSNSIAAIASCCLSQLFCIVFSTPGLVVLVVAYSIMGAFLFPLLEAPQDSSQSAEAIAKSREDCLRELWIITEKLNVLYERNWTMLVHEQLRRFEGSIVAATRSNAVGTRSALASTTAVGHFGGNLDELDAERWSFSEALLYSVTVITTIGHGSLAPKTAAGKIATILYALIGVPLMLMCLSSLGALLAEALQCTYARICCRLKRQRTHKHKHHNHHQHHHHHSETEKSSYQRHCSADSLDTRTVADIGTEMLKQSLDRLDEGLSVCAEKSHALNCKNCKYDTITGATTQLSGDYECESGNNAMDIGCHTGNSHERTGIDAFQLLHNSQAKLNQNGSPTIKTTTTTTAGGPQQYYQQRTDSPQQQQQQHQHADVMLMPTTQLQQQQQQQQFYSRSATPSPQHFQQPQQQLQQQQQQPHFQPLSHPLQTFHIMSTASANSSPTHQQLPLRQYATLQPQHYHHQQHSHHCQQQQQQQHPQQQHQSPQHFVAVPSSLVRFQHAPSTPHNSGSGLCNGGDSGGGGAGGVVVTTNMPPMANCYQSASVPATASATIFFPMSAANAANGPSTTAATAATTVAAAAAAAASQLLCQQPIVKYHTIQLQHNSNTKKSFITATTTTTTAPATVNNANGNVNTNANGNMKSNSTMATGNVNVNMNAASSVEACPTVGAANDSDIANGTLPLPPPPAYQTATVHSIRRAKYLNKPLPPEINSLLAENDITCRHDLLQNNNNTNNTTTTTPPPTIPLLNNHNNPPSSSSSTAEATDMEEPPLPPPPPPLAMANCPLPPYTATSIAMLSAGLTAAAATNTNATATSATTHSTMQQPTTTTATTNNCGTITNSVALGSSATVDIMEDEEEQEQQRLGNCPHGTPSRVPLISGSFKHSGDLPAEDSDKPARNLINATAASFHRHTLQTFQRNALRKTINYGTRRGCNMHASVTRAGCYGTDTTETSDDDEYMQRAASEQFPMKQLNVGHKQSVESDNADDTDTVDDSEGSYAGPQVPISVVLLILICYICLGTMIFAFWENWSIIDGAYFCFVTLATIGYGDFLPERTFNGPEVQLFACCAYLLLGLVLVAMSFSILETQLMWKCKRIAVRLKLAKD